MTPPQKYSSGGPKMSDVSQWAVAYRDRTGLLVRWTWTRGATDREFKVTAQAYRLEDGYPRVYAQVYSTWPTRECRTVEALMLRLLVDLERAYDHAPAVEREADLLPAAP